jgi:predicted transglutaminase-like cysteine proteinase
MKHLLISLCAVAASAALTACLAPGTNAVDAAYREPRGNHSEFHGLPNGAQRGHLYSATFPRLLPGEKDLLRRVNIQVNRDLAYLSDLQNYGRADYAVTEPPVRSPLLAALPPARYADCEDYALTKKKRLDHAGFSASRTFVATATVPQDSGRTTHSVLAVPEGGEWLILNNWHNQIERASSLERWWDWQFIRPRYDSYLLSAQTRRIKYGELAATTAPAAAAPSTR